MSVVVAAAAVPAQDVAERPVLIRAVQQRYQERKPAAGEYARTENVSA